MKIASHKWTVLGPKDTDAYLVFVSKIIFGFRNTNSRNPSHLKFQKAEFYPKENWSSKFSLGITI